MAWTSLRIISAWGYPCGVCRNQGTEKSRHRKIKALNSSESVGYKIKINVRHRGSLNQPQHQGLCDVELPLTIQALGKAVQRDVCPRALDPARSWSSVLCVLPKHCRSLPESLPACLPLLLQLGLGRVRPAGPFLPMEMLFSSSLPNHLWAQHLMGACSQAFPS